jgi:hypothetical protein
MNLAVHCHDAHIFAVVVIPLKLDGKLVLGPVQYLGEINGQINFRDGLIEGRKYQPYRVPIDLRPSLQG